MNCLAEVIFNESKVIGTLSIKYMLETSTDDTDCQSLLTSILNNILSNINQITDQSSFISITRLECTQELGIYLSLLSSNELMIKYSTDQQVVNSISSDQDQLAYDLGNTIYSSVLSNESPQFKISTLSVPIKVRY